MYDGVPHNHRAHTSRVEKETARTIQYHGSVPRTGIGAELIEYVHV